MGEFQVNFPNVPFQFQISTLKANKEMFMELWQ